MEVQFHKGVQQQEGTLQPAQLRVGHRFRKTND